MYPVDTDNEILESEQSRTWPTRLLASCMLIVMLCGIAATPLAIALNYLVDRQQPQQAEEDLADAAARVNRIAYLTEEQQLYTVSPDGSDRRQLTSEGGRYQFFVWSPDGERIAAVGPEGLVSMPDLAGAASSYEVRNLYAVKENQPFYAYWSPTSEEITFLTSHSEGLALHLAEGDGTGGSRILETGQPFYWVWHPDSDRLFIHIGQKGQDARLAFLDTASGTLGENISDPGPFQSPGIAADGRYLTYARSGRNGSEVVIHEVDGEAIPAGQSAGAIALSMSPTAPQVAYISSDGRGASFFGPLRIAEFDSDQSVEISSNDVWAFFWSPNGRFIAYLTQALGGDDVIQAAHREKPRGILARLPLQQDALRLELWIYDLAASESIWLATFHPTPVFLTQILPFFDQYALSHRLWSPGSDALVLPIREENGSHIYAVPINGEGPKFIANGEIAFWSWQ